MEPRAQGAEIGYLWGMLPRLALGIFCACALALACVPSCLPNSADESSADAGGSRAPPSPSRQTPRPQGIHGTISSDSGGVPDAQVCASWQGSRVRTVRADVTPRCTKSDDAGRYTLELSAGVWLLVASARGYLPSGEDLVLRAGELNVSRDFVLLRGGAARVGTLIDLDRAPIADARIVSRMSFGGLPVHSVSVQTDAEGRFDLWTTDEASLTLDAPGHIEMMVREGDVYTALPESVLEGRVVDEGQQPVGGARVAYVAGPADPPLGFPEHAVLSDADGGFRIDRVSPGDYQLVVYRDDIGGTEPVSVAFAQHQANIEVAVTSPLEWVRAQVVEPEVGHVAGCLIGLQPSDDRAAWPDTYYTDENGRLDVPTRPGARFSVEFLHCPGKVGKPPYDPLLSARSDAEAARLEVAPGHTLRGRVVDTDGHPLAGLEVAVGQPDSAGALDSHWSFVSRRPSTTSDAAGRFEIMGLFPGEIQVRVEGGDHDRPSKVTVTDQPTTEVILSVARSERREVQTPESTRSRTVVHVVDPAGQSVGRVLVTIVNVELQPTSSSWWNLGAFAITDSDGRAIFERGCDERLPCTAMAARPGLFGTASVAPGRAAESEIAVQLNTASP